VATASWGLAWTAYGLATTYLETAHTLQPVREYGSEAYFERMYGPPPVGQRPDVANRLGNSVEGDGARFCGRGYVQLTGRRNYTQFGELLNLALVDEPDLALRPDVAGKILEVGMREGLFTSHALGDYLPEGPLDQGSEQEFKLSRYVINGTDRATDIAGYALKFQEALLTAA
jgi:putative chitinase